MKKLAKQAERQEMAVANKLKELRLSREMTQEQLADGAGIDRKTVNRIENQHFSPNLNTLLRLCAVLSVKPSDLLKNLGG